MQFLELKRNFVKHAEHALSAHSACTKNTKWQMYTLVIKIKHFFQVLKLPTKLGFISFKK